MKTVSRDVHGIESVVYTDTDGNILGAARSGQDLSGNYFYRQVYSDILDKGYVDIHISGYSGIVINNYNSSNHNIRIFDLITEEDVTTLYLSYGGGLYSLPQGFYRIEDTNNYYVQNSIDNVPALRVIYSESYYDLTYNVYDLAGRLQKTVQPLSDTLETTFRYNSLSQLLETTSTDEGTSRFKYRKDGQIRFSQNSEQAKNHSFSYTNYDFLGRPLESGVYVGTDIYFTPTYNVTTGSPYPDVSSIIDDLDGLPINDRIEQNISVYDVSDTDLVNKLQVCGIPNTSYVQTFLAGNVSYTYTQNPTTNKTWYSYDGYGRVKWMVQQPEGLCLKTIDYEYDAITGQLVMVDYQRYNSSERFVHHYTYNIAGQLVNVETSIDGITKTLQAHYIYNESGALVRTELATDLQGIDYVYNLNGQLKAINHPSLQAANDPGNDGANGFASDVFGMQLDYYNGDYTRSNTPKPLATTSQGVNQYNGNIKATRWNTQLPSSTQNAYLYEYNRNNWLTQATFGQSDTTANITPNVNNDYKVSGITYDANGNLMTLNRKGYTDAAGTNNMDNFSYRYDTEKKNRLLYVQDTDDNIDEYRYSDIKNQNQGLPLGQGTIQNQINYVYNDLGQLVTDVQGGISYDYNASGLVTKISGFSSNNTGNLATIYYKNHTIPQTPVLHSGWTVVGSPATNKFSAVIPSVCGLFLPEDPIYEEFTDLVLLQHLGSGTARTNLKIAANTFNTIEFKLLVDKYLYKSSSSTGILGGTETTGDPIIPTVVVTLKKLDGSIITTQTINDQPSEYCNQYFAETVHLEFTSAVDEEAVILEISPSHNLTSLPLGQKQQIFFDNLHVQAAVETKVAFEYNDRGHRIQKTSYNQNTYTTTNYVRDASGTALAVYETTINTVIHTTPVTKIEHGVYGNGRIGVYKRGSGKLKGYTLYELTDHLGNVRAVISKAGRAIYTLTSKTDYYPFGMPMPNKHTTDGNYRYAFQGQEKDPETGMEAFELRLWDGRLGRWLTVDPYHEFHSPYVGMGNNPISLIDPDGGSTDDKRSPIFDKEGNFIAVDSEGYQGEIIIMSFEKYQELTSGIIVKVLDHDIAMENNEGLGSVKDLEAMSKITTHVLKNTGFDINKLHNGQVSIKRNGRVGGYNEPSNTIRYSGGPMNDRKVNVTVNESYFTELKTVELVESFIGVHEFTMHGLNKVPAGSEHYKAYLAQKNHKSFHKLPKWAQEEIKSRINDPQNRPRGFRPPLGWKKQ